jgi:hypothetical protein
LKQSSPEAAVALSVMVKPNQSNRDSFSLATTLQWPLPFSGPFSSLTASLLWPLLFSRPFFSLASSFLWPLPFSGHATTFLAIRTYSVVIACSGGVTYSWVKPVIKVPAHSYDFLRSTSRRNDLCDQCGKVFYRRDNLVQYDVNSLNVALSTNRL